MPEPEQNKSSFYPNTPGLDGKPTAAMQEKQDYNLGLEEIRIPREPLYGSKGVDSFHVRDAGIHLYDRCKDSRDLAQTLKHYTAAYHGAGILDDHTVLNLKSLTKEIEQAPHYQAKKEVFDQKVRPFILGLKVTKIGGAK